MSLSNAAVPVIVDTDIGDDIDDTWALAYLLASSSCDVKLIVTAFGDSDRHRQRAAIIKKLLEAAGQPNVPVALGVETWGTGKAQSDPCNRVTCAQGKWAECPPATMDNSVDPDGIKAMQAEILNSPQPVTIVALAPLSNVAALAAAAAASGQPLSNARLVAMQGSLYKGYGGSCAPSPEHNVACDPAACAAALQAPWHSTPVLAPLDICSGILLEGELFQRLRQAACLKTPNARLVHALLEGYTVWAEHSETVRKYYPSLDTKAKSTPLFDVAAAFLALHFDGGMLMELKREWIQVTEDGLTRRVEPSAQPGDQMMEVVCALEWQHMKGTANAITSFAEHVVDVLLTGEEGGVDDDKISGI